MANLGRLVTLLKHLVKLNVIRKSDYFHLEQLVLCSLIARVSDGSGTLSQGIFIPGIDRQSHSRVKRQVHAFVERFASQPPGAL